MAFSLVTVVIAIPLAILLSFAFYRKRCYSKNIYAYALAFGNSGYLGDPLVLSLFGEKVLAYYKLACLPTNMAIFTWGVGLLIPNEKKKGGFLRRTMNPPLAAMLLGMLVGFICGIAAGDIPQGSTAYDTVIPNFLVTTIDSLKVCMGPVAMILAGVTIANYSPASILKNKKVYYATALRLVVLPVIVLGLLFGVKELINLIFNIGIDNTIIILMFFVFATPLGLNTVVYPEAYGGDSKTGASMTLISHTLCVITIPIMFALLLALFGDNTWVSLLT